MATIDEISIRIDANVNTALQNLRKVQAESAKTERALKGLDDDIDINVKADTKAALNSVKALQASLAGLKSTGGALDIDVSAFQAGLKRLRAELDRFERSNAQIDIRANINDALRQLRQLENAIDRVGDQEIDVRADTSAATAALARLDRNLTTDLFVDTNQAALGLRRFSQNARLDIGRISTGGVDLAQQILGTFTGGGNVFDIFQTIATLQATAEAQQASQRTSRAASAATRLSPQEVIAAARAEYTKRLNITGGLSQLERDDPSGAILSIANSLQAVGDVAGDAAVTGGRFSNVIGGLTTKLAGIGTGAAVAAAGIGAAVVAGGAFAVEAGRVFGQVQLADTSLKAVSKTTLDYAVASAFAKEAQSLLGGSITQNIEIIRQLQLASNLTGASLEDLLNTSLLLSVTNPAEGLEGAAFALRELLTGDYASLVERFNLPRSAVQNIRDLLFPESGPGISAVEALREVNKLLADQGVTLETVTARTLTNAAATEKLAAAWERLLYAVGGWPSAIGAFITSGAAGAVNKLADAFQFPVLEATVGALEGADSFTAYVAEYERLVELQRERVGTSGPTGNLVPEELTESEFEYIQLLKERGLTTEQAYKEFSLLSKEARANIDGEIAAVKREAEARREAIQLSIEQAQRYADFVSVLKEADSIAPNLAAKLEEVARAPIEDRARDIQKIVDEINALDPDQLVTPVTFKDIEERVILAQKAIDLENRLRQISLLTGDAQKAAAEGAAKALGITVAQLEKLLGLYLQLNSAAGFGFSVPSFVQIRPTPGAPTGVRPYTPPKPTIVGGGKSKADQEAEELERLRQRILEAERRYRKELLKIEADYYKRSNAARVVFSDQQFSSRASFYDRLAQFEDQGVRQTLSAQYEQAQIDAGKISDQFGGDVAERFLQASEDAILARAQRQLGIQTAESEGRFGDAEYLRGVDRLYRIEEDRRIERSKGTEDSIAADRNEAVKDAADDYKDTLEGFIIGENAKLAAVKLVNDALREQGLLGSTSVTGEGGAVSLNIQSTQLDDIKKSIDALALRLPVGV